MKGQQGTHSCTHGYKHMETLIQTVEMKPDKKERKREEEPDLGGLVFGKVAPAPLGFPRLPLGGDCTSS